MVQCGNPSGPAKGSANSEVYAVLLGSDGAEPVRSRSSKPARRCVAVGWSLLVTLAVALVTVVLFQLWATWHLHNKVLILQAQIDSMSALDLEELRSQLRDLYDLRDFSNAERDALDAVDNDDMEDVELEDVNQVLRGHPTSADEDQVPPVIIFAEVLQVNSIDYPQKYNIASNGFPLYNLYALSYQRNLFEVQLVIKGTAA